MFPLNKRCQKTITRTDRGFDLPGFLAPLLKNRKHRGISGDDADPSVLYDDSRNDRVDSENDSHVGKTHRDGNHNDWYHASRNDVAHDNKSAVSGYDIRDCIRNSRCLLRFRIEPLLQLWMCCQPLRILPKRHKRSITFSSFHSLKEIAVLFVFLERDWKMLRSIDCAS